MNFGGSSIQTLPYGQQIWVGDGVPSGDTTVQTQFQLGDFLLITAATAGVAAWYRCTTAPSSTNKDGLWTACPAPVANGSLAPNMVTDTGANNALVVVLNDSLGTAVPLVTGLELTITLAHTLQAGGNTISYNGSVKNLKSSRNVGNNIATAYAATGILRVYYDGTQFVDLSQ